MFELVKIKYRDLIDENNFLEQIEIFNKILNEMQEIWVKNDIYHEQKLLQAIEPFNKINHQLYVELQDDIIHRKVFEV